jgi:ferrous iron transport protein B
MHPSEKIKKLQTEIDVMATNRENFRDEMVKNIYDNAKEIASRNVSNRRADRTDWGTKFDRILTSKYFGFPLMLLMLGLVFWITIVGANYPSAQLSKFLFWIESQLSSLFMILNAPSWLHGLLIKGVYRTVAWVVAVMLQQMAIFFPIFTLLEDWGLLPRIAFNLDNFFKKAGANGKQSLTMSMGFGCNAAGVIATRIIESPREKLIAILTNNFVPCNGRFPTLIILASLFMGSMLGGVYNSFLAALVVVALVLVGIMITLLR